MKRTLPACALLTLSASLALAQGHETTWSAGVAIPARDLIVTPLGQGRLQPLVRIALGWEHVFSGDRQLGLSLEGLVGDGLRIHYLDERHVERTTFGEGPDLLRVILSSAPIGTFGIITPRAGAGLAVYRFGPAKASGNQYGSIKDGVRDDIELRYYGNHPSAVVTWGARIRASPRSRLAVDLTQAWARGPEGAQADWQVSLVLLPRRSAP